MIASRRTVLGGALAVTAAGTLTGWLPMACSGV
jgi:hypothetical protein